MVAHAVNHAAPVALLLLLFSACTNQGETAVPSSGAAVPAPAAPRFAPTRTIEQRSPFGNTTYPANLLVDGDFEFTGRTEQMPWILFGQGQGQTPLRFETGGRCRSGIRCALMDRGETLLGFVASPKTVGMRVSLWVLPLSGVCHDVRVAMVDLGSQEKRTEIPSETEHAASDGWCHFSGATPNFADKEPVLFVDIDPKTTMGARIDDGLVMPTDVPPGKLLAPRPLSSAELQRAAVIAEYIQTHRRYGRPPLVRVP